jgi:hypothetical protein
MRLTITSEEVQTFRGTIEYPDDGTMTEIEGKVLGPSETTTDVNLATLVRGRPANTMVDGPGRPGIGYSAALAM